METLLTCLVQFSDWLSLSLRLIRMYVMHLTTPCRDPIHLPSDRCHIFRAASVSSGSIPLKDSFSMNSPQTPLVTRSNCQHTVALPDQWLGTFWASLGLREPLLVHPLPCMGGENDISTTYMVSTSTIILVDPFNPFIPNTLEGVFDQI